MAPKLVTDMLHLPPYHSAMKVEYPKHVRWGHQKFQLHVRMWLGDRAAWLLIHIIVSTTNGLELTIPFTSTNNVLSDSSSKLTLCVFHERWEYVSDWICLSHTLPIWPANAGFLFQWIQSALFCNMNTPSIFWLTSFQHLASSLFAPTKLLPLSHRIVLILPHLPLNLPLSSNIKSLCPYFWSF